jgi:hypothetical protein
MIADEIAGGVIRQVTHAAHDALAHRPRVIAVAQRFEIVIRFQDQQIRRAEMKFDRFGDVAKIGDEANLDAPRLEAEPDRVDRVVGNGEAADFDIADRKTGAGAEAFELGREITPGNRIRCEAGDEDRHTERARERHQAADMIGMLVCDQDGVQLLGVLIDGGEARENVALA